MFEVFNTPEVLIGIVGVLVTMFVPLLYRNRRKVFYDVIAEFRLLDKAPDCEAKDLSIAGRSIKTNPKVFVIELNNHWSKDVFGLSGGLGYVDITPDRYERAVSLEFGNDAQILHAQIVDETPPGIREVVCVHRTKIMLKPVLLNHGDSVTVKAVVENPDARTNLLGVSTGDIRADGRITGIRGIQRSWSTLKTLLIGEAMVSIGGLTLGAFDFVLPSLLGYPPFEGYPFLPYYRGLFSALFGFGSAMLLGGFLLNLLFFARQRIASEREKEIRASYFNAQSKLIPLGFRELG